MTVRSHSPAARGGSALRVGVAVWALPGAIVPCRRAALRTAEPRAVVQVVLAGVSGGAGSLGE